MDHKVTIVGSGNVGATAAQRIVERELADVVMLDILSNVAMGKALDILESAPILGFNATIEGGGDYAMSAGSDICILTAGLVRRPGVSREDLVVKNAEIVRGAVEQLIRRSPDTILLIVTNPLDAMCEVARRASGFPRERVLGMAGVLDASRMRYFIAHELGVSVEDVDALVLGGHGDTMLALPRLATVNGVPLPQLLRPERIQAIVERTREGAAEIMNYYKQGAAYYTPSAAVVDMVAAILKNKRKILPCSAYLQGEYGIHDTFVGVPCKLGRRGVEEVVELPLDDTERAQLLHAAETVQKLLTRL
ncbi:MAG: malate dehydrogenase [Acidobacteriota bacterium]